MDKLQWNKMRKVKRNRRVAELCGWHDVHTLKVNGMTVCYGWHPKHHSKKAHQHERPIPNFLEDLNAMRQAEAWGEAEAPSKFPKSYVAFLIHKLTSGDQKFALYGNCNFELMRSTAAQRAEAFYEAMTETWS